MNALKRDFSLSALVAGMIAVAVSYAGPAVIVFQAARAGHLSTGQLSSWIWAISLGSGLTGLLLSLRFKAPVITAWSTPGAALLVTSLAQYRYGEVVGAYMLSAVLITLFGVTGLFSWIMERIPKAVIAAMLAGVLLRFGTSLFTSFQHVPVLVAPIVLAYFAGKRWFARYAVVAALAVGLCAAGMLGLVDVQILSISLARPVLTPPEFSLSAMVGLAVPLCFVTMASQNAPGYAVLQTAGYRVPVSPLITTTGLASLILAPFGAHGINLAAITAAICTGPESHAQPERRYVAGVACGSLYIVIGVFGTLVASVFSALPDALIAAIAGLALLGALAGGIGAAMADDKRREPPLIAFLITASGVTFFGVGAAFWGLLGGVAAEAILFGSASLWAKPAGKPIA
ncbi:MAG: benzoate/H(+) symporter BenE family transporter [Burkholderiaceae bacterium]